MVTLLPLAVFLILLNSIKQRFFKIHICAKISWLSFVWGSLNSISTSAKLSAAGLYNNVALIYVISKFDIQKNG